MHIATHDYTEFVYVRGTHEDFKTALAQKVDELMDSNQGHDEFSLDQLSHSIAVDAEGTVHWSLILRAVFTFRHDE
jgi:hypothetical protein